MLHILSAVYSTPWAITDTAWSAMTAVLERWALGIRLDAAGIEAAIGNAPAEAAQRRAAAVSATGDGVQVIPIYGVMTHRAVNATQVSRSLTASEAVAAQVRAAAADPQVGTIVLDIDSPGGAVAGTAELADVVYQARAIKPVIAVANSEAASAAYWVASQASEIVVTPSGMVGSIGVRLPYTDESEADAKAGIRREYLSYGRFKSEGMGGPLSAETRQYLQGMVDSYGNAFTRAVAKGRGLPVDVVRGEAFGEGRMKLASDAVASGMADRIGTLDDVIAKARKPRRGMSSTAAQRQIEILET